MEPDYVKAMRQTKFDLFDLDVDLPISDISLYTPNSLLDGISRIPSPQKAVVRCTLSTHTNEYDPVKLLKQIELLFGTISDTRVMPDGTTLVIDLEIRPDLINHLIVFLEAQGTCPMHVDLVSATYEICGELREKLNSLIEEEWFNQTCALFV